MANVKNQHSVNLFTNKLVNLGKYGATTPTRRCGLSGGRRRRRNRHNRKMAQRGGGGYGADYSSPGKGLPDIKSYSDCGVTGSTGVGKQYVSLMAQQKGGSKLTYGSGGTISYGYDKQGSSLANTLKGGYAPINRVIRPQCGGRKRSRRRRRKRKSRRRTRRKRRCSKCPSRCCACCCCRGKRRKSCRCRKCPKKCCPCCRCKKKHRRRKTKRRRGGGRRQRTRHRNQRGGYHQYRSNTPNTLGMALPNGGGYHTANPPTFSVVNSCVDNYNHYKGAGSASPVLDKNVS